MYCCLSGGLGNQMFQYAAAYILKQHFPDTILVLDDSYYFNQPQKDTIRHLELDQFKIIFDRFSSKDEKVKINRLRKHKKIPLLNSFLQFTAIKLCNKYSLNDASYYNPESIKNIDVACLFSFYQDSKLLNEHRDLILPLFEIRDDLRVLCHNLQIYSLITDSKNITSIHVRRGDYVNNKHAAKFHGTLSMDYYISAMEYIESECGSQTFITDNLESLCQDNNFVVTTYNQKITNYKNYKIVDSYDDDDYLNGDVITKEELDRRLKYASLYVNIDYNIPRLSIMKFRFGVRQVWNDFWMAAGEAIQVFLIIALGLFILFGEAILFYKLWKKMVYKHRRKKPEYYPAKHVVVDKEENN